MKLSELNSSTQDDLASLFRAVCHSDRWVQAMCRSAPFSDLADLQEKGRKAWSQCGKDDWLQALEGHPRIGEKARGDDLASRWSRTEQSQAETPDERIQEQLRARQDAYYEKFGFIFLIFATGKSPAQILEALERRLPHSVEQELPIVAQELGKILHLRLEKLLS